MSYTIVKCILSFTGNIKLHPYCAGRAWISVACDMAFLNWLQNEPPWLIMEVTVHFFSGDILPAFIACVEYFITSSDKKPCISLQRVSKVYFLNIYIYILIIREIYATQCITLLYLLSTHYSYMVSFIFLSCSHNSGSLVVIHLNWIAFYINYINISSVERRTT